MLEGDADERKDDDVAQDVHQVALTVKKAGREHGVPEQRVAGSCRDENEVAPNPIRDPFPGGEHRPKHLHDRTEKHADRDAHGDGGTGSDRIRKRAKDRHKPENEHRPFRRPKQRHGEVHASSFTRSSFELWKPTVETGGFLPVGGPDETWLPS